MMIYRIYKSLRYYCMFSIFLIGLIVIIGSGGGSKSSSNNNCTAGDSFCPRSFNLSAAPYQFQLETYTARDNFDTTGFSGKVDLLSLHMDFFGIPWTEFSNGSTPPAAWLSKMAEIKQLVDNLGVGVFLSLTPLSNMRDSLKDNAKDEGGELVKEPSPINGCFDFSQAPEALQIENAYKAYVRWMVDFFKPLYLVTVIEQNLYGINCPDQYNSLIQLSNEVYNQEKTVNPDLIVFQTFTINHMWGYDNQACAIGDRTCLIANLNKIDGQNRDRFGISSYPIFMYDKWAAIPDDYYSAVTQITGDLPVFGEIGYPSGKMEFPWPNLDSECFELYPGSEQAQADFLTYLFEKAHSMNSDLICWWSLRDFLPEEVYDNCPCSAPGIWCDIYNVIWDTGLLPAWVGWGSMGVLDYNVQSKPSLSVWEEWKAKPVKKP